MSPAPPAPADRLLEYVRILAPLVEAERQSLDAKRELSPTLLEALHTSGLFRLWLPGRLGGAELDLVSGLRVIAAVAALDGSVGWNVMEAAAGLLALLPRGVHGRATRRAGAENAGAGREGAPGRGLAGPALIRPRHRTTVSIAPREAPRGRP